MLLAIDIGNSSIKFGVFDDDQLVSKFSIPTKRDSTADDLKRAVDKNISQPISAAIICSVVPEIDNAFGEFIEQLFQLFFSCAGAMAALGVFAAIF